MKTRVFFSFLIILVLGTNLSAQTIPNSRDWYVPWLQHAQRNTSWNEPYFYATTRADMAQRFSYDLASYILPAYLYATQIPAIPQAQRDDYLDVVRQKVERMFGTTDPINYFGDVPANIAAQPNGLNDGFTGWANCGVTGTIILPKTSEVLDDHDFDISSHSENHHEKRSTPGKIP